MCGEVSTEKNVLFVNVDYGVGLGILIDGKIYYGKSGFSGEFGHAPIFENEIICHCGKKGCLETEASGTALIRRFRERIQEGSSSSVVKKVKNLNDLTVTDLIQAANAEDMLCIELLAEVGEKLGKGLAALINVFNPELIILGGTLFQHIPDDIPNFLNHQKISEDKKSEHQVSIIPETLLSQITKVSIGTVNSSHHQAINKVPPAVIINAIAPDGVIEGIECPKYKFCLGVQWHPEYRDTSFDIKIIEAFVKAAQ